MPQILTVVFYCNIAAKTVLLHCWYLWTCMFHREKETSNVFMSASNCNSLCVTTQRSSNKARHLAQACCLITKGSPSRAHEWVVNIQSGKRPGQNIYCKAWRMDDCQSYLPLGHISIHSKAFWWHMTYLCHHMDEKRPFLSHFGIFLTMHGLIQVTTQTTSSRQPKSI